MGKIFDLYGLKRPKSLEPVRPVSGDLEGQKMLGTRPGGNSEVCCWASSQEPASQDCA